MNKRVRRNRWFRREFPYGAGCLDCKRAVYKGYVRRNTRYGDAGVIYCRNHAMRAGFIRFQAS